MQITSLLDACQYILEDQGEPQSSYWLVSQIMEMKLWRASEADVRDAVSNDITEFGDKSRFIRVAKNEIALRVWAGHQGFKEFKPASEIGARFPSVAKWVRTHGWIEIGTQESCGFVVRVLDEGGLIYESQACSSFNDAMACLETRLDIWFDENR